MIFFKDFFFLHDVGVQNLSTYFGKTGFENHTQVVSISAAQFRFTVYSDFYVKLTVLFISWFYMLNWLAQGIQRH